VGKVEGVAGAAAVLDEEGGVRGDVVEESPAPELVAVALDGGRREEASLGPAIDHAGHGDEEDDAEQNATDLAGDDEVHGHAQGAEREAGGAHPGELDRSAGGEAGHGRAVAREVAQLHEEQKAAEHEADT